MFRVAVFASGQGSNFQALADAAAAGRLGGATVDLLVCDKPEAPVVKRAEAAGVDTFVFRPKEYDSREAYETEIKAELESRGIDLIVLAGYMRLITPVLVESYSGRMVNIHPSLLPAFAGKDAIGQALDYGVKLTGITVHLVDGGMDTGAVVAQQAVEITAEDSRESLEAKIHAAETKLYPEVVAAFAEGRVTVEGRKVTLVGR
ncbi:phosphoribosylglycinamide formyltransferase [Paenibacillus physcomitrellae]|uniref:Phosphoribosylglycinamide formyltransferase n=1 Tax=Paenibacillus physcomitrellae TaxID=1619311 RepID=A0ABQ1GYE1_9BACL|nr:phosphoribosylglycinamide formyltransferase [Paenibacillus physcomitrellae]GGA52244.1 phosphoribosylglycinamide formyltransferase [Paenibacillus physcomitrellae]